MKKLLLSLLLITTTVHFVRSQNGTCIPPIGIDCVTSPMYIDSVYTTGAVNNFTNDGTNCNAQDQNYQDYPGKIVVANANGSFLLHVALNPSVPAYIAVWVDWSDNLVFASNELIYASPNQVTFANITVNVPPGPDTVIMRVRCANTTFATACDSVSTGETEDYRVVVVNNSGVNEVKENKWSFYPNPTAYEISIHCDANTEAEFSVIDVTGKIVRSVHSPNGNTQIDVHDLAPGMYFLQCTSGGVTSTKRFVRN